MRYLEVQMERMLISHNTLQSVREDIYSLNDKHTETRGMVETLARAAKIRQRTANTRQDSVVENLEALDVRLLALEQDNNKDFLSKLISETVTASVRAAEGRVAARFEKRLEEAREQLRLDHKVSLDAMGRDLESAQKRIRELSERVPALEEARQGLADETVKLKQTVADALDKIGKEFASVRVSLASLQGEVSEARADKAAIERTKSQAWSAEQTCTKLSLDVMSRLESSQQSLREALARFGHKTKLAQVAAAETLEEKTRNMVRQTEIELRRDFGLSQQQQQQESKQQEEWGIASSSAPARTAATVQNSASPEAKDESIRSAAREERRAEIQNAIESATDTLRDRIQKCEVDTSRSLKSSETALRLIQTQGASLMRLSRGLQQAQSKGSADDSGSPAAASDQFQDMKKMVERMESRLKEAEDRNEGSPIGKSVESLGRRVTTLELRVDSEARGSAAAASRLDQLAEGQAQLHGVVCRMHESCDTLEESVKYLITSGEKEAEQVDARPAPALNAVTGSSRSIDVLVDTLNALEAAEAKRAKSKSKSGKRTKTRKRGSKVPGHRKTTASLRRRAFRS